jgi:[protein-PII] uridylyltransferase
MHAKVYGHPKANRFFKQAMMAEVEGRRARYGSVVGMQEPHLKEGAGGLRDLHLVGWVGLARWGFRDLDELLRAGLVTPAVHARALRAYDFILRVRNEAHFQTGRRTDLIALDLQPSLAEKLGYSDQRSASASEIFMRDFYMRARSSSTSATRSCCRRTSGPKRRAFSRSADAPVPSSSGPSAGTG